MSWWIKPLSSDSQDLLATERDFDAAPEAARHRALARARAALGNADARPARTSFRLRPAFVAAALVLAVAAGAFAAWRTWSKRAAPAPAITQPAQSRTQSSAPLSPPALPAPDAVSREHASPPRPEPAAASVPPVSPAKPEVVAAPSPPSAADVYALELEILGRARAAVASGDFAAALRAVASHQRRFPAGRLQEEREALRIKALSGLGRTEEARRAAARFRERFPRSVLSQPR